MNVLVKWIDSPEVLAQWGGPSPVWPAQADRLWQQIDAETLPSFSLEEKSGLQAFGQLSPRDQTTTWHLCRLIVAPHLRGRRLGEKLCRHLEAQASLRGATRVTLNVAIDNPPALRLYRRLGYANTGSVDDRGIQTMARQL